MSDGDLTTVQPWRFQLFGEPKAEYLGRAAGRITYRRSTLLLVRLASVPHRVWMREELAELFWPGEYGDIARDRLRQTLAVLNKALRETGGESPIIGTKTSLSFDTSKATVDTEEFAILLRKAKATTSNEEKAAALQKAIALAQAPFASGLVEDWVKAIRDQLSTEVHEAKLELAKLLTELERLDEAQSVLQEATLENPLSDQAHALRARIYRDTGRIGDAATVAKDYRERLKTELGFEANPHWEALFEEGKPLSKSNLPRQIAEPRIKWLHIAQPITRFFGRDRELEWLSKSFGTDGYRLITISGPGGSGKTRLSVEFASKYAPTEAVILGIGLAELDEAALVPYAIAEALGLPTVPGNEIYLDLAHAFDGSQAWIVLDNCEHLMPEIGNVVNRLLGEIPSVRILCTSRVLLGLQGERELALNPLETPPLSARPEQLQEFASVDMLVERLQASRPDYRLTDSEAPVVAELIEKLEGLPLAIEIAASRGSVMTTQEMLYALESRLDFLSSKYSNLPKRHRAMRNALEWSFNDLSPDLRELAFAVSVFAGSWTMQDAQPVINDPNVAEGIHELRSRSLIRAEQSGDTMRFRMLEVVRQFAQEQMSEAELQHALTAHQTHIAHVCDELYKLLDGPDRAIAVRHFRQILPDYRAACSLLLSQLPENREAILSLLMKPVELCEAVGILPECSKRLKTAIEKKPYDGEDLVLLKALYGVSRSFLNDIDELNRLIPTLIEEVRKPLSRRTKFVLLNNLSDMIWQADMPAFSKEMIQYLQVACDDFEEEHLRAIFHLNIGNCWQHLKHFESAIQSYSTAIQLAQSSGALRTLAHTYRSLNILHRTRGDAHESLRYALHEMETVLKTEDLLNLSAALRSFIASSKDCNPSRETLCDLAMLSGFEKAIRRQGEGRVQRIEGSGFTDCVRLLHDSMGQEFNVLSEKGELLTLDAAHHLVREAFTQLSCSS